MVLLAFATAVFRCDVIVLAAPVLLVMLIRRQISFMQLLVTGVTAGLASIGEGGRGLGLRGSLDRAA